MKLSLFSLAACTLAALAFSAHAASPDDFAKQAQHNWHQWRGPNADGVSHDANPPTTWDETKNVKWKVAIPGDSTATPIIWGNRIFVISAIKTDREGEVVPMRPLAQGEVQRMTSMRITQPKNIFQFRVAALDRGTGETIWEKIVREEVPHEGVHADGSYAAASPTTDGENVYVSFGSRGVYCFDFEGNTKWTRDFGKMAIFSNFGESTSPVLHGDVLIHNWDQEGGGSFIVALDKKTGKDIWKINREESTTWMTPLIVDYKGKSQVITYSKTRACSYDLADGSVNWEFKGKFTACIPCPVASDGLVYLMTGYTGYCLYAVPLDSKGDLTDAGKFVWERSEGTPYVPSPLLDAGLLYMTQENKAIYTVLDAKTGTPVINKQRLQEMQNIYASPVSAGDRVFITSREGNTAVIKKGPSLDVLSVNTLKERVDASLAIVGNEIFIRSRESLYCIAEK